MPIAASANPLPQPEKCSRVSSVKRSVKNSLNLCFLCSDLVSCPDPPNAPREKGSGQKGRTSVSPRSKSCGANQIAEA